jgi:membrane-associated phospholipid phosphatase
MSAASNPPPAPSRNAWLLPLLPLCFWALFHFTWPEPGLFYQINRATQLVPDIVWGFFVFLGNGWGVYAMAIPVLLLSPRIFTSGVIGGLFAGILSRILKIWLDLPRPAGVLDPKSFHIVGNPLEHLSLPSGHTLTAFSVATAFYFAVSPAKRRPALLLFIVAMLAGLARVAVGAHWPADVFAGATVGLFSGLVGATITRKLPFSIFNLRSWLTVLFFIFGLVDIYLLNTMQMDFAQNHPFQVLGTITVACTLTILVWRLFKPAESL